MPLKFIPRKHAAGFVRWFGINTDVDDVRRVSLRNNVKSKEGCPLEFDVVDATMRDRRSGEALSQDKAQALGRELCADKGATVEGNHGARDTAAKAVSEFLSKNLKP